MKVKNSLNATEFPKHYERNTMPSMTIPDQTMSLDEILKRYAKGLPLGGTTMKVPLYDEDDDMPDIRTLDLAERQELAEHYTRELNDLRNTPVSSKQSAPTGPLVPTENSMEPAGPPIS